MVAREAVEMVEELEVAKVVALAAKTASVEAKTVMVEAKTAMVAEMLG